MKYCRRRKRQKVPQGAARRFFRLMAELDDSQDASAGIKGDDQVLPNEGDCNQALGSMMIF